MDISVNECAVESSRDIDGPMVRVVVGDRVMLYRDFIHALVAVRHRWLNTAVRVESLDGVLLAFRCRVGALGAERVVAVNRIKRASARQRTRLIDLREADRTEALPWHT